LQAWADYVLQAQRVRIQEENTRLLGLVASTAASRVRAGGSQQEQLRADVAARLAENELATARTELEQQRAMLNNILRRSPEAPLQPPSELSPPRRALTSDDAIIAAGVNNNADLAALGFDESARRAAIVRARQEYLPEINPMAAFTGSISQSVGAAIALPTQLPKIRSMISEARSDLRRVQAGVAGAQADRASQFAVALLGRRGATRSRV
jgi:outer membrane protein TolC